MDTFKALTPGSVAIILIGVAFLGGAIGSFLNVVIYRLPAGLSLIHPPSRCPKCEHPIRPYDNVPVLGWILLRGKCRDCGEPISARYPMIEAIMALTFLVVVWLEWFGPSYGIGLPGRNLSMESLVARAGLHVMLFTTLLAVGMIQWDGGYVSIKIWLPVILVSIGFWAFFPDFAIWSAWDYNSTVMEGMIDGLVGAAVGLVVGGILWLVQAYLPEKPQKSSTAKQEIYMFAASTVCIGLAFGWQVIVGVGLFYLPIQVVFVLPQRMKGTKGSHPDVLCLFAVTLLSFVAICFAGFLFTKLFRFIIGGRSFR